MDYSADEPKVSMQSVSVINANLIRRRMRSHIANRIMDSFRKRDLGLSIDMVHLLTCLATAAAPSAAKNMTNAMKESDPVGFYAKKQGIEKGECSANDFRLDYIQKMTSDPFVALFGGGPNIWPSRLVTSDLMPNISSLNTDNFINASLVPYFKEAPVDVPAYRLSDLVGSIKNDDVLRNPSLVSNKAELEAWFKIENQDTARDKGDDAEDSDKKMALRNMMAVEVVNPGVPFIGQILVKDNDVDLHTHSVMTGLILLAINDMNETQIGGMIRNGWGNITTSIAFNSSDDDTELHLQHARDYIENVTYDDLMEAFGVAIR